MRLGLDFDNTVADYEHVFPLVAAEMGFLAGCGVTGKSAVRDAIRRSEHGERGWQKVQGQVYGRCMPEARMFNGVLEFLDTAREIGAEVFIVSHKTVHGHFDSAKVDLRRAATDWMTAQGFFDGSPARLEKQAVHFLASRDAKIARIAELSLDVFVDDLPEVLNDPGFPEATRRILFTARGDALQGGYESMTEWSDITSAVFHDQR